MRACRRQFSYLPKSNIETPKVLATSATAERRADRPYHRTDPQSRFAKPAARYPEQPDRKTGGRAQIHQSSEQPQSSDSCEKSECIHQRSPSATWKENPHRRCRLTHRCRVENHRLVTRVANVHDKFTPKSNLFRKQV